MPDLINVTEMYLKAVLELHEARMPKRRVRIAQRLEQTGPTVTTTVARLRRDDLLSFSEESKVIDLTDRGFHAAMDVMRKHRLAECLLADVVGLDWSLVHEEACRWEHVMSDDATERIDDLLQHPSRSPYGNPIPSVDATHWDPLGDDPDVSNLVRVLHASGWECEVTIEWIGELVQISPPLLRRIREIGAVPGARVRCSLHGASVIHQSTETDDVLELPHELAAQLFVRP